MDNYTTAEQELLTLQGRIVTSKVELQKYWNRSKYQLPDKYIHDKETEISELINKYSVLWTTYNKGGGAVKFSHPSAVGSSYII